jgi:flagellar biosynthesis protein FlhB
MSIFISQKFRKFIYKIFTLNFDEENNQFSVFIPGNEGIQFEATKEGIRIFTKIIPDSIDNNIKDNKSKKTNQKMIAPYLLVFLSLFISMWSYAVIAIYPEYQTRIKRQKVEEAGRVYEEVEDLNEKKISVFSFSEFISLILLSFFICGTLFFFVSRTVNSIIKENQAKLQKAIPSKKSTKEFDKDPILS